MGLFFQNFKKKKKLVLLCEHPKIVKMGLYFVKNGYGFGDSSGTSPSKQDPSTPGLTQMSRSESWALLS